jgi:hypothetical protein
MQQGAPASLHPVATGVLRGRQTRFAVARLVSTIVKLVSTVTELISIVAGLVS